MSVHCNMCDWDGEENDLIKVLETEGADGGITHEEYTYGRFDETTQEVIDACPNCLTDEYLTDTEA